MQKYILEKLPFTDGDKETFLYDIHQTYYGTRFKPIVYCKYNSNKVEQIDIIDLMNRTVIKECYQVRSANTFMNKLFKSLTRKVSE